MAALRSFRNDPDEEARDLTQCQRDIDRLRYRPLTVERDRLLTVHVKWLERMKAAACTTPAR